MKKQAFLLCLCRRQRYNYYKFSILSKQKTAMFQICKICRKKVDKIYSEVYTVITTQQGRCRLTVCRAYGAFSFV